MRTELVVCDGAGEVFNNVQLNFIFQLTFISNIYLHSDKRFTFQFALFHY